MRRAPPGYEVIREISRGGMGIVSLALRPSLPEAHEHRARARAHMGKWASTNRGDSRPEWEAAIVDYCVRPAFGHERGNR